MFVEPHSSAPMRGLWSDPGTGAGGADANEPFSATRSDDGDGHANLIYQLIYAVENTHHSPTLLPYPQAVVDSITGLVVAQTKAVEDLVEVERQEQEQALQLGEATFLPFHRSDILKFELQRVQFLLCELLRSRLHLIDKLCFLITDEVAGAAAARGGPQARTTTAFSELLSSNELAIALRIAKMKHACMLSSGLRNAPEPLQHLVPNLPHGEGPEILPVVELGKHVCVYLLQDIAGPVELAPDVSETMSKGEIFLVPFASLSQFVADGRARLI